MCSISFCLFLFCFLYIFLGPSKCTLILLDLCSGIKTASWWVIHQWHWGKHQKVTLPSLCHHLSPPQPPPSLGLSLAPKALFVHMFICSYFPFHFYVHLCACKRHVTLQSGTVAGLRKYRHIQTTVKTAYQPNPHLTWYSRDMHMHIYTLSFAMLKLQWSREWSRHD